MPPLEDSFDIPAIDAALAGTRFGGQLHHFVSIDSTNALAMAEGARGAVDGSVYIADEQTAGRGRGDHAWHSEPNVGLYVSVLLRPKLVPSDALWLSLIAAIAVHSAVASCTGLAADIRWPNDLLLGERKFGGILTELNADATRVRYAVVGMGLNVNHTSFPPALSAQATSLRIAGANEWPRQPLLIALLKALDRELHALDSAHLPGPRTQAGLESARRDILIRFESVSSWVRGKFVQVAEGEGYAGITAGLDEQGFLLVETSRGQRRVLSGGVRSATQAEKKQE